MYDKILMAAKTCFENKGFNETSIRDVANNAGVSLGAIYNHFKSKEEIIFTVANNELESVLLVFNQSYCGSALEQIIALATNYIMSCSHQFESKLWAEILSLSTRNKEIKKLVLSINNIKRNKIRGILKKEINDKCFVNTDVDFISFHLSLLLDGFALQVFLKSDVEMDNELHSLHAVIIKLASWRG